MLFAKFVLIAAIMVAAGLGVMLRVRAWKARRKAARAAWNAEVERALRGE